MSFGSLATVTLTFTVCLCRCPTKKPMAKPAVKLEQDSDIEPQSPLPVPRHLKGKVAARLDSPIEILSEESGSDQIPVVTKAKGHPSPEVPVTSKTKRQLSPEVPFTPKAKKCSSPEVPVTPEAEAPVTPKASRRLTGSQSVTKASKKKRYWCTLCLCLPFG